LGEEGYQVLKNEAIILKEMNHPNIVKFYDVSFIVYYNNINDLDL